MKPYTFYLLTKYFFFLIARVVFVFLVAWDVFFAGITVTTVFNTILVLLFTLELKPSIAAGVCSCGLGGDQSSVKQPGRGTTIKGGKHGKK